MGLRYRVAMLAFAALVSTTGVGCFDYLDSFFGNISPGEGETTGSVSTDFSSSESYCGELIERGGLFGVSCYLALLPSYAWSSTYVGASEFVCSLCLDPIVMQFPSAASNFAGTFTGTTSGNLVIQAGLSCINTTPGEPQLCAEAGNQLVIVDLPSGTPYGNYSASIAFSLPSAQSIQVKAISVGQTVIGGIAYYPPLFPCVASFTSLPSVTIPVSDYPQQLVLPDLSGFDACQGIIAPAAAGAPQASALSPLLLAVLAAGLAIGGVAMSRRRRA